MSDIHHVVGAALHSARCERGLSIAQAADLAGLGEDEWAGCEAGCRRLSAEEAYRVTQALELSVSALFRMGSCDQ